MSRTLDGSEVYDFSPFSLPPKYLEAIGLLSAAASSTDALVEHAIAGMLGLDAEQGWAVTAHMSAPLRASVLRAAAEIVLEDGAVLDELDQRLAAIKIAQEARNDMIHGSWCVRPSDGAVLLVSTEARTHVDVKLRPTPVGEIESKAIDLYNAGMSLMNFMIVHGVEAKLPRTRDRNVNTPKARKGRRKKSGK